MVAPTMDTMHLPHVNFLMGWPALAIVAISCSIRLRSMYIDSRHSTTVAVH